MTETIQNPLSADQNVRAAAVSFAAEVTKGRSVSTDDVLDLADYIVGPEPCPLAGLMEPITLDLDLGEISKDAMAILLGADTKPAEPEVITVRGVRGLNSLPVGSVVEFPGVGRYYQLTHGRWTHEAWLSESKPHSIPAFALSSTTHVLVEYIPGGA